MPMVVYTEDEVIAKCEEAEADGARRCAADRDRATDEAAQLRKVLGATHQLITEGALVGFIPTEGTWAERLFKNQGAVHDALNPK